MFFHANPGWLEARQLPVGETMLVSGRVEWFNGDKPTMVHPDHMVREADAPTCPWSSRSIR